MIGYGDQIGRPGAEKDPSRLKKVGVPRPAEKEQKPRDEVRERPREGDGEFGAVGERRGRKETEAARDGRKPRRARPAKEKGGEVSPLVHGDREKEEPRAPRLGKAEQEKEREDDRDPRQNRADLRRSLPPHPLPSPPTEKNARPQPDDASYDAGKEKMTKRGGKN